MKTIQDWQKYMILFVSLTVFGFIGIIFTHNSFFILPVLMGTVFGIFMVVWHGIDSVDETQSSESVMEVSEE